MATAQELPLRTATPARWAAQVLAAPLPLLSDHAFLEKKAATNALDLLNRWPDPDPPTHWVRKLAAIARDEVEHLGVVARLLAERDGALGRLHRNPYAAALRKLVRLGEGPRDTLDRLLVSALIEGRSCERFAVLAAASPDSDLARIYKGLHGSELGHFLTFRELAEHVPLSQREIATRWNALLDAEAEIIATQPPGPRVLSGVA
jgi:tRNA-(ms[2]io[6]A)-hydroxylase